MSGNRAVVPLPTAFDAALIQRHQAALDAGGAIPEADLPALIEALERRTRPATPDELQAVIALIMVSWPNAFKAVDETTKAAFFRVLTGRLAEFPAAVVYAAVREAQTAVRFDPLIADFHSRARLIMDDLLRPLGKASDQLAEHARRRAQAEAEAAAQAMREHAAAKARAAYEAKWTSERDHLVEIHGHTAASVALSDIEKAPAGIARAMTCAPAAAAVAGWQAALNAGEAWALRILPIAAMVARVHPAYPDVPGGRGLRDNQAVAVLVLAEHDVAGARILAGQCEAYNHADGPAPDLQNIAAHAHPLHTFAEIVRRYRAPAEV